MKCPNCNVAAQIEDTYPKDGARVRTRRCIGCKKQFQTRQPHDSPDESLEKWLSEIPLDSAAPQQITLDAPKGAQWLSEGLFYKFGLRGKLFVYRAAAGWVRASFDDLPDEAEAVKHA